MCYRLSGKNKRLNPAREASGFLAYLGLRVFCGINVFLSSIKSKLVQQVLQLWNGMWVRTR